MKYFEDLNIGDKVYTVIESDEIVHFEIKEYEIVSRDYVYEPPHLVQRWVGGGCGCPNKYKPVLLSTDEYKFGITSKQPESLVELIVQKPDMSLAIVQDNDSYNKKMTYYANKKDAVNEVKRCYEQWMKRERSRMERERNRYAVVENNYKNFVKENE